VSGPEDQRMWESIGMNIFLSILWAASSISLWYFVGVPYEVVVLVTLALIKSETGSLWRVYVR
jgi:hypothetical protein